MIHKDFWGRCTSSSLGAEAKVYAKSVELRYANSGEVIHYNVDKFKNWSPIRWEARIVPHKFFQDHSKDIAFTKFTPFMKEEEETALQWPDPRVGKLVMVEKYTDELEHMTPVIFVLAAIFICLILFNK